MTSTYEEKYLAAYNQLNPGQKEAVDTIYGPVMTLAGPGTGKTQLLSVRIGHIIRETDTDIRNILCLTFTDAGAHAMKQRLLKLIGPEAHNANIYTFHSFCNEVIRSNPEYFGGFRELSKATDLELVDVFREIIDEMPEDHPLKRLGGNIYYEKERLQRLFTTLKREGWTVEDIREALAGLKQYYIEEDDAREDRGEKPKWKYMRKSGDFQKGDFKQPAFDKELVKYDKTIAAAGEVKKYNEILDRIGRFDYNDMIQWVIDALQAHPELQADYQERYQYILVDEYQDTNGTQNELIFLLADNDFDDRPNIFIVGDDDQAIYRFQGANMTNIQTFQEKYNPKVVVLENNYRSYQGILDRAQRLISNNEQRLAGPATGLEKNLIESRLNENGIKAEPRLVVYPNRTQEELGCIQEILRLREEGVPLENIAVIYRKHSDVDNMVKYLSYHGVPLNVKRKVDVLKQMDVLRLMYILEYLHEEFTKPYRGNHMVFELMHYDFFEIPIRDIALISMFCSKRTDDAYDDKQYRDVICDEEKLKVIGVSNTEKILRFSEQLDMWQSMIANNTLQVLFESILTQSGLLDQILRSDDTAWRLQVVNTFFNLIKEESDKDNHFTIQELMDMLEKMDKHGIALPISKVTTSEQGINFLTVHGSKGLEFEHVFMIKCDQDNWLKKFGSSDFKIPPTLSHVSTDDTVEDERRLFFVAMTRAKDNLYISYSLRKDDDSPITTLSFLLEIWDSLEDTTVHELVDTDILNYKADLMRHKLGSVEIIDHDLIDHVLKTFSISPTSLNKYIDCPVKFYFENILRVPSARNASMGFGNAIHGALESFFEDIEKSPDRVIPDVEVLLKYFRDGMDKFHSHFTSKEKELSIIRGENALSLYYAENRPSWQIPRKFETERKIKTEYAGVPITGNIDRIDVLDDGVRVVDYKTGKYRSAKLRGPTDSQPEGGDYWRQIIFYKLLMDQDLEYSGKVRSGVMSFVEPEKDTNALKSKLFEIADFEIEEVKNQLVDTYAAITDHKFDQGCDEDNCKWCNFVKDNMPVRELTKLDEDDRYEG